MLAETAGYVVFGVGVSWGGKNFGCAVKLNQFSQEHEPGEVGHPGRLVHVVGDDDDGVFTF